MKIKNSEQTGRTIIETLAYIMVMITITASISALVSKGYSQYENSSIQQGLYDLKKTIFTRYAADGQYSKISWDDLCKDRIGPRSLMPERKCVKSSGKEVCTCETQSGMHVFGGKVNIGSSDCNESKTHCSLFYIEFRDLPKDICGQLASKSWDTQSGSDLEVLVINGKIWLWEDALLPGGIEGTLSGDRLPISVNMAIDACNGEDENNIRWYFN